MKIQMFYAPNNDNMVSKRGQRWCILEGLSWLVAPKTTSMLNKNSFSSNHLSLIKYVDHDEAPCMHALMAFNSCHRSFSIAIFLWYTHQASWQDILCSNPTAVFRLCRAWLVSSIKKMERARKQDTSVDRLMKAPGCSRLKNLLTLLEMHVSPSLPNSYTHTAPINTTKPSH